MSPRIQLLCCWLAGLQGPTADPAPGCWRWERNGAERWHGTGCTPGEAKPMRSLFSRRDGRCCCGTRNYTDHQGVDKCRKIERNSPNFADRREDMNEACAGRQPSPRHDGRRCACISYYLDKNAPGSWKTVRKVCKLARCGLRLRGGVIVVLWVLWDWHRVVCRTLESGMGDWQGLYSRCRMPVVRPLIVCWPGGAAVGPSGANRAPQIVDQFRVPPPRSDSMRS